jgi:murein DD-endopeptidase MepM/ murein hydrolase activator NlpD
MRVRCLEVATFAAAALTVGCGPSLQTRASVPHADGTVSEYDLCPFSGGTVHVRLAAHGFEVAEWMTNSYAIPVAVDVDRKTTNLRAVSTAIESIILVPGALARVAMWEVVEHGNSWSEHTAAQTQFGDPSAQPAPYLYGLPFAVGEAHRINQGFNGTFSHNGEDAFAVDFVMPQGTPVRAAREGTVVAFNDQASGHGVTEEFKDRSRANWILVRHSDGTIGEYWHLERAGVRVAVGQQVTRGEVIGLSGFTGHTTTPHLHFEIRNAVSGRHVRSFPFVFKSAPDDLRGQAPVEGRVYSAFE